MEEVDVRDRASLTTEGVTLGEERMVQEDRWQEIHRMCAEQGLAVSEIACRHRL